MTSTHVGLPGLVREGGRGGRDGDGKVDCFNSDILELIISLFTERSQAGEGVFSLLGENKASHGSVG